MVAWLFCYAMLKLIKNADLYLPGHFGPGHVLIAGRQIVYVGKSVPQLGGELSLQTYDLDGRRLIPGFIDGHAHITGGGGEAGFATQVPTVPISGFIDAGVTTVIGLLGTDDLTRTTSAMLARVYGLREEGLSAYCYTGGYHLPPTTLTGSVKSDIVHIECILGVGEVAISDHRSSQPTFDELIKLAGETHVAGLMTGKAGILHIHLGDGLRRLQLIDKALAETELPARVFNPTHVNRGKQLFDEACELAAKGCWIDVTAFPVAEDEDAWSAADALIRYWQTGHPNNQITISSDGGGCLPHFNTQGELISMDFATSSALPRTLSELLSRGIKLQQALPPLTSNPAELLRLPQKGRITCGADADLLVLDNNVNIFGVMALGEWHRYDGRCLRKGTFE